MKPATTQIDPTSKVAKTPVEGDWERGARRLRALGRGPVRKSLIAQAGGFDPAVTLLAGLSERRAAHLVAWAGRLERYAAWRDRKAAKRLVRWGGVREYARIAGVAGNTLYHALCRWEAAGALGLIDRRGRPRGMPALDDRLLYEFLGRIEAGGSIAAAHRWAASEAVARGADWPSLASMYRRLRLARKTVRNGRAAKAAAWRSAWQNDN